MAIVMPHGKVAGAERVMLELLAEVPPEEALVCAPVGSALAGRVTALGHEVHDFHLPKLAETRSPLAYAFRYLAASRSLYRMVRRHRVRVLHPFVAFAGKAVAPVALLTGTPAILTVQEITTRSAIGRWRSHANRWMAAHTFRRITGASNYVAETLVATGYPADRVTALHAGISRSAPRIERVDSRRERGLPSDALVFVLVARMTRWKGHEVAVGAFARFCAAHPGTEACLAIVGGPFEEPDVRYEKELRAQVERTGLGSRVVFFGHRDDAEHFYDASDVVLAPSVEPDPFPTVVLEAGFAGRPIVVTSLGGGCEAVVDGTTGVVASPTADDFAAAMAKAADPGWREEAGRAARIHVEREFSRAAFAGRVRAEWERAAQPSAS